MTQIGSRLPFSVVPWDTDFLAPLKDMAERATGGRPGRAVIVFPNSRPRRYMEELYRREGRPMRLPRLITVDELRDVCLAAWSRTPPRRRAEMPDMVALLRRCVAGVARSRPEDSPLRDLDKAGGMARFLPWGMRLAALLEECANQMVEIPRLNDVDGVLPFASALLADLRGINGAWMKAMDEAGLSTRGLEARQAALAAREDPPLPPLLEGRALFLAGFVRLTASEDMLFRYLWERGAHICLHSDPGAARGGGHWSCADHREWIRNWDAGVELACPSSGNSPEIRFFAGYDLHSQLAELARLLKEEPGPKAGSGAGPEAGPVAEPGAGKDAGRAVVLPHPSLLMPVLQHLPERELNISLGYPLERSQMARLADLALRLREGMRSASFSAGGEKGGEARWPWRLLLELVTHPCLRMLSLPGGPALRPLLREAERELRRGGQLVRLSSLMGRMRGRVEAQPELRPLWPLWERCVELFISAWRDVSTLRGTARRLGGICELLLRHGERVWPKFPLDAECLFRLMKDVIPALADNAMAGEELPPESLFAVVRQYLAGERVPFEADPLTALQVLGTLETRLLRFDRVYLLDMTEDRIPGAPGRDPLLPDNLRGLLGLPDKFRRASLEAHTFYRLLAGAKEVVLFWQEGVNGSELLDTQKQRSRFVEECLWRKEKRAGRLLGPGDEGFGAAGFPAVAPPVRTSTALPRTELLDARMERLLSRPLAPTLLDAYVRCPARFCRQYLLGLWEKEEVPEGDDYAGVGDVVHTTLYRAYEPWLNKRLRGGELSPETLLTLFHGELEASGVSDRLPAESLFMLKAAVPRRFAAYLAGQPEELTPLWLEHKLEAPVDAAGVRRMLEGRLDRVDRRGDSFVVVDYKTGHIPGRGKLFRAKPGGDVLDLWRALPEWTPQGVDFLPALADALPSLQLPCYVLLGRHALGRAADNAVWEDLGKNRRDGGDAVEIPLFADDLPEDWHDELLEGIPGLFAFVLDHMARTDAFSPREGEHCRWCPFAALCR